MISVCAATSSRVCGLNFSIHGAFLLSCTASRRPPPPRGSPEVGAEIDPCISKWGGVMDGCPEMDLESNLKNPRSVAPKPD